MTDTPKEVYIDPFENRTFVGTWHTIPPEGAECIKYIPESELATLRERVVEAEKSERDAWESRDRMLKERAAVLDINTTDGLSASEWVLRTALAEKERSELRVELARVREADNEIFLWLLGHRDFPERQEGDGAYWWRKELRMKLALQGMAFIPRPVQPEEPEKGEAG